jgi:DNA-binding LacI/PurR family transcriptional regulator
VLQAAADVSYTVNRAARALVTRRSDSIAFVVAEAEDRFFADPYFMLILRTAQAEVAAAGLQLIFVVASSSAETEQFVHYASGGHVDGVLLVSLHGDDQLPQRLESIGIPTVLNGRPISGDRSIFYVDSANTVGGRAATELLIERGCRRIATITGPLDMSAGRDRLTGYRDALTAAGLPVHDDLITEGDFTIEGGARAMGELLQRAGALDAVFAASDLTALGALSALRDGGRAVPGDVAVVGFDDVREARLTTPALTTIRQPIDQLGQTMARVLLDRIAGRADLVQATVLPVEVVRRASA